ncbi:MAG: cobalamin B12-binding domain-containing protein [Nitrospirae bacterium]|nr:cobalamin B12-binding domain-containing protein [Nitrospirota bacterium]
MAKVGMDGHDRGIKVVSTLLREAGYEVVYLGKLLTPETVVAAAVQESVDAVGLSFLSGEHVTYTQEVAHLMEARGLRQASPPPSSSPVKGEENKESPSPLEGEGTGGGGGVPSVKLFVGGVFPNTDIPKIKQAGADDVFPAGTLVTEIVRRIQSVLAMS